MKKHANYIDIDRTVEKHFQILMKTFQNTHKYYFQGFIEDISITRLTNFFIFQLLLWQRISYQNENCSFMQSYLRKKNLYAFPTIDAPKLLRFFRAIYIKMNTNRNDLLALLDKWLNATTDSYANVPNGIVRFLQCFH